jgi:hypothetical protein
MKSFFAEADLFADAQCPLPMTPEELIELAQRRYIPRKPHEGRLRQNRHFTKWERRSADALTIQRLNAVNPSSLILRAGV